MATQDQFLRQDVVAQQDLEVLGNTQLGNDPNDLVTVSGRIALGGTVLEPVAPADAGPGPLTNYSVYGFDTTMYDAATITVTVVDDANTDLYMATYNVAHMGGTATLSSPYGVVDLWGGSNPTFSTSIALGFVQFEMSLADTVSVSVAIDAKLFGTQSSEFITIVGPSNDSVTAPAPAQFVVTATSNDSGTLSYQWEEDNGGGFAALTNAGIYSGVDTDTLDISDSTGLDTYQYRCVVSSTGGAAPATSAAATLTVA